MTDINSFNDIFDNVLNSIQNQHVQSSRARMLDNLTCMMGDENIVRLMFQAVGLSNGDYFGAKARYLSLKDGGEPSLQGMGRKLILEGLACICAYQNLNEVNSNG